MTDREKIKTALTALAGAPDVLSTRHMTRDEEAKLYLTLQVVWAILTEGDARPIRRFEDRKMISDSRET